MSTPAACTFDHKHKLHTDIHNTTQHHKENVNSNRKYTSTYRTTTTTTTSGHTTPQSFQLLFKPVSNETLRLQTANDQADMIADFSKHAVRPIDYDAITTASATQHTNQPAFRLPMEYRAQQVWPKEKLTDIVDNMLERDNAAVSEAIRLNDMGLGSAGFGRQARDAESARLWRVTGEQPVQASSQSKTRPHHKSDFQTHWHNDTSVLRATELPSMTVTRSGVRESPAAEPAAALPAIRVLYHEQHSVLRHTELPSNVITRDVGQYTNK